MILYTWYAVDHSTEHKTHYIVFTQTTWKPCHVCSVNTTCIQHENQKQVFEKFENR